MSSSLHFDSKTDGKINESLKKMYIRLVSSQNGNMIENLIMSSSQQPVVRALFLTVKSEFDKSSTFRGG